jgi:hypothetical protein
MPNMTENLDTTPRWGVIHPVELAKLGGTFAGLEETIVLSPDQVDHIERMMDQDDRLLLYVYAAYKYWDGFRCRHVSACEQYIPLPRRHATADAGCAQVPFPLGSCEYPVSVKEYAKPEECGEARPQAVPKYVPPWWHFW